MVCPCSTHLHDRGLNFLITRTARAMEFATPHAQRVKPPLSSKRSLPYERGQFHPVLRKRSQQGPKTYR